VSHAVLLTNRPSSLRWRKHIERGTAIRAVQRVSTEGIDHTHRRPNFHRAVAITTLPERETKDRKSLDSFVVGAELCLEVGRP
jgi:hypothetical protein